MKMKRGVELSLNTVILIVIGLIVAAIIIYMVATSAGGADDDLRSCRAKGGVCKDQCDPGETGSRAFIKDCDNPDDICCRSDPW